MRSERRTGSRLRLLAGTLALTMTLTGCGGFRSVYDDIFGETESSSSAPAAVTELSLPVDIDDSLNPYAALSDMNLSLSALLFDPLFLTDNSFSAIPCLAESISGSGPEYLVSLR